MKKSGFGLLVSIFMLVSFIITGCVDNDPLSTPNQPMAVQDESTTVSFKIAVDENSELKEQAVKAVVTVIASDMINIIKELTIIEATIAGHVSGIPSGAKRKFEIAIYDSDDNLIYKGSNTVDLKNGEVVSVPITLFKEGPKAIIKEEIVDEAPIKNALTWKKITHNKELGIDLVGASGGNAYSGDTPNSKKLPILGIKIGNHPRPNYPVTGKAHAMSKEYYRGWASGTIKLTPPIKGTKITSLEKANELCRKHLGEGYRMAEFHDGKWIKGMDENTHHGDTWPKSSMLSSGGWYFWAYGNIPEGTRFWVHIDNQNANPW